VYRLNKDTIEGHITHYIDFKDTPLISNSEVADERYRLIDRNAEEEIAFINARDYYERSYLSWDKKEEQEERTVTITETSPPILKPTVITEEDEE